MSDFQVLAAVRRRLLQEEAAPRVHLALPPKAIYPFILVELEEIWSSYPFKGNDKRNDIQARVKFKVSACSRSPGMEEAAYLSDKMRKVLEGATLWLPDTTVTIRFLACVAETSGRATVSQQLRMIHHFYDCIVRR